MNIIELQTMQKQKYVLKSKKIFNKKNEFGP